MGCSFAEPVLLGIRQGIYLTRKLARSRQTGDKKNERDWNAY